MNEATFQAFVTQAIKSVCDQRQKKMTWRVPSSNMQSPVKSTGEPYDVGILLDNTFLVGLEFKVLQGGVLCSWNADQHQAYLSLTIDTGLSLPLYYAYNAEDSTNFTKLLNDSKYQVILESSRISTPVALPGEYPEVDSHYHMHRWLTALLEERGALGGSDWLPIFIEDSFVLEKFLSGFPDVIWLLVTAHHGVRVSWALSGLELASHIDNLRNTWDAQRFRDLTGTIRKGAIESTIAIIDSYLLALEEDQAQQHENSDDMEDRPSYRYGPR
jgi:hypothetical protein